LNELASSLKPPADIDQVVERLQGEFEEQLSAIEDELPSLDELKMTVGEQLRWRSEEASNGTRMSGSEPTTRHTK
jgi:hypothetical protein